MFDSIEATTAGSNLCPGSNILNITVIPIKFWAPCLGIWPQMTLTLGNGGHFKGQNTTFLYFFCFYICVCIRVCMLAQTHANVPAHVHACIHKNIQMIGGLPQKPSLGNFAFFTENNKMWDLPYDCQ